MEWPLGLWQKHTGQHNGSNCFSVQVSRDYPDVGIPRHQGNRGHNQMCTGKPSARNARYTRPNDGNSFKWLILCSKHGSNRGVRDRNLIPGVESVDHRRPDQQSRLNSDIPNGQPKQGHTKYQILQRSPCLITESGQENAIVPASKSFFMHKSDWSEQCCKMKSASASSFWNTVYL